MERDYLERTIATVRVHRGADNCWPQWANIFADEIERLRAWHDGSAPIIAALAIYGEAVNVAALVEKARALNEAKR